MSSYKVPAESVEIEEVIKASQFITRVDNARSVEEAKAFIKHLNQTYPDATHHCWAYIIGNPNSTTLIGCSDDGELAGTAGKPMLNVLQHANVGDIVIVCTRYYGGTKLGTGGLVRAYGNGVKIALNQLSLKLKINYVKVNLQMEYPQIKDFQHLLKDFQSENLIIDYNEKISITIDIASDIIDNFTDTINNKFKGQVLWNIMQ